MIQTIVFYAASVILIASAVMVVTQRSIFTCALYLAAALSSVAFLFILLSADFLAAVQILLYVGGILVIIVFAVMLSSLQESKILPQINEQWLPSLAVCAALVVFMGVALNRESFKIVSAVYQPTTLGLGHLLLGEFILPFEVVSLVLLGSLVGAVLFSKKETAEGKK